MVKTGQGTHKIWEFIKKYNIYIMLIVSFTACVAISPNFLTVSNISNIGRQYAGITIISMGMLMVIMTGGIDLSVGSIVALSSVLIAQFLTNVGIGLLPAILLTVLVGGIFGLVSGVAIAKIKMPAFIVTMAMLTIGKGFAFIISNGSPLKTPKDTLLPLGKATVGVVPLLVIIAIIVVIIFQFIQTNTVYGRIVKAIGSNETAVRLSGIRVERYIISVYAISGMCAALGGIISASRTGIGSPLYGSGLELDAIAACVIGGASLAGGEGSASKTLVGVLVLAFIGNIMNLLSVPSYPQDVIKGLIILGSILLQIVTSGKKAD